MVQTTTCPSLIGREGDLESLRAAFGECVAGVTHTVVLGGEAGIGKTRLVEDFAGELPDDALVLRGQSVDLDKDAPPYAPIIAPLRALTLEVGERALLEASGPARDALLVLLPELGDQAEAGYPTRRGGADRLYEAVAATLENVARTQPLVIIIEDLHWADHGTLALLRFLVRVIERARILFVFTFRSDELGRGSALRAWLPELDRNRRVERRELSRLNRRQVKQMAIALLGSTPDERELGIVYERTDGVPFFIEELVGCDRYAGVDSFPDTLRDLLLARYEQLSDPTQCILRLLAAGGVRVEHELLALVTDATADEIDAAAREAVFSSVLVVDDTAYAFRHALVREAIHEQLLPGERVRYHTRYAQALDSRQGNLKADATAISYHWMAAHSVTNAFTASIDAMIQARQSYAFSTAARMGERAIELWQQVPDAEQLAGRSRVELLAETSYILRNAGESDRAIALIDEAIAASSPSDAELYARILRDKASYLANVGQGGSIALLRQALVVLSDAPRSVLRAHIIGELAARLMLESRFDEAVDMADAAYTEALDVGSRPRMSVAANIRGFSRLCAGEIDAGLVDLAVAGELADGNDSAQLRYWVNQSDAMYLLGRYDDAIRIAEEGAERARSRGVERTSGVMLMSNVIGPLLALGQTRRADEMLDRALELDPPIGFSAHLQRLKLQSVLWSGDVHLAERMLRGWRGGISLQLRIDAQLRFGFAAIAGEIALARGDVVGAWQEVSVVIEPDHRSFPADDLPLLVIAARVVTAARSTGVVLAAPENWAADSASAVDGEASDSAETAEVGSVSSADASDAIHIEERLRAALAACSAWPTASAHVAVFNAEFGGSRRVGTDPQLWSLAVTACAGASTPAQLAPYAAARLAEVHASAGDRVAARIWAERARQESERIGMGLVAQRVIELERRVGAVKTELGRFDGPHAGAGSLEALLTKREIQVLELIAQGLSNRVIAERLFISVKTASVHVSNILRKTGATTRTEAAYVARTSAEPAAEQQSSGALLP